jgi:hypothetical protein
MEQARDHDQLGISGLRALISAGGNQSGFLFSLPVYRSGPPPNSIEDRRRNLAGFVHGSVITGKMVETIFATNKMPEGLDSFFFARDAGPAGPRSTCTDRARDRVRPNRRIAARLRPACISPEISRPRDNPG